MGRSSNAYPQTGDFATNPKCLSMSQMGGEILGQHLNGKANGLRGNSPLHKCSNAPSLRQGPGPHNPDRHLDIWAWGGPIFPPSRAIPQADLAG
jgi:hypothetical protein